MASISLLDWVRDTVRDKLAVFFEDMGEQALKNIARPVRVYRVNFTAGRETSTAPPASEAEAPPLPDKPSIAVLPFQNMSGDPAQEYFADGMVEEIITALSRIRWLFVIARNSSFTYKGARRWTSSRSVANSECATCWRARSARLGTACALPGS